MDNPPAKKPKTLVKRLTRMIIGGQSAPEMPAVSAEEVARQKAADEAKAKERLEAWKKHCEEEAKNGNPEPEEKKFKMRASDFNG